VPLTYIDTGVLIAAFRGTEELSKRAIAVLAAPERDFASSDFVRLELMPKATYNKKQEELDFYDAVFSSIEHWAQVNEGLIASALDIGNIAGLSAMDALHVASARQLGVEEIVTSERTDKPLHRVQTPQIVSLAEPAS
jgi:predicted nucleic acid-binding protein